MLDSRQIDVSAGDARFVKEVTSVIDKHLPQLTRLERFLSIPILVITALAAVGILGVGAWALKILWQEGQKNYVIQVIEDREKEENSPSNLLSTMSEALSTTFKSQVDSGTFKVLRFGCTPPGSVPASGFPACATDRGRQFQAQEDQRILFVANPSTQSIRLDLSMYAIDKHERLERLLLQIYAEPPPMHASAETVRTRLILKPEHLAHGAEFLQDGRLRLIGPSGALQASINLTPVLDERKLSGPMQLRFTANVEPTARGSAARAGGSEEEYPPASGTELFFIRTITSAYHTIPSHVKMKK